MNNDYIERYIYAVTRGLSSRQRGDVERELRSLIGDMLDARCKDAPPSETDVRVVLAELGTARELASKYNGDNERYLIGPKYYPTYIMMMKLVLGAVAFGLAIATVVMLVIGSDGKLWYEIIGDMAGGLISGLLGGGGAITLCFVIMERRGVKFDSDSDNDWNLPPVPAKRERIGRGETISAIVLTVLFVIVFIGFPQVLGFYFGDEGWVTLLDTDVMRSMWWATAAVALLNLIHHAAALIEMQYTNRYAVVASVTSFLSLPFMTYIWLRPDLFNPAFWPIVQSYVGDAGDILLRLGELLPWLLTGATALGVVLDIIGVWRRRPVVRVTIERN